MTDERRGLGWQPDAPDARDEAFSVGSILGEFDEPPDVADNRLLVVDMYNQINVSSCVGQAIKRADHMLEVAAFNAGKIEEIPEPSSALFHYYNARFQHQAEHQDSGTFIRLGIRQANDLGMPPMSVWPYEPWVKIGGEPMWKVKPKFQAYQYASADRVRMYRRIAADGDARIDQIKRCIADGMPVVFGTYIAKTFTEDEGDALIGPPGFEPIAGGHAMVMIGYDNEGVWICNSWGKDWRDSGFAKLSWEYITWTGTRDIWALS